MPTIALIGPGAIGGTLASFLLGTPSNDLSICARSTFSTLEVRFKSQTRSHRPTVHLSTDTVSPVDWILIASKTYQIPQAAAWLPSLTRADTRLAIIQNGVEHIANLAPHFGPARLVPVIIDCPVERKGPGQIIRHGDVTMDAPNTPNSADFAQLFNDPAVTVRLTDDWTSAAWRKLCINCAGAVSALANQPANILKDPEAAAIARALIEECIAVGRAEGATLDDSIADAVIASQRSAPEGSTNSIHADLVAGRPMEWDARNGVITRLGRKHRIPTPCNEMAAHLLSLLETRPTTPD